MSPFEVSLERPVAGGRMLARAEGKVVLVAGGIPGERVRVAVERAGRQVTFARVVEVLAASPDRREPPGDPACGGLAYGHIAYERQRQLKGEVIADTFRRVGRISWDQPVTVAASPEAGYRLRARLHVRGRRAGFFREHSHDLCDPAGSGQLRPDSLSAVHAIVARLGAAADDCEAVIVAENVAATERLLHLEPRPGSRIEANAIGGERPAGVSGVTTTSDGRRLTMGGAARFTETVAELCGDRPPDGVAGEVGWARSAEAFFQGNRYLTGVLLRSVLARVPAGPAIDVYAGVGLFAVAMAARGDAVLAIEGDRASAADLVLNARPFPRLEAHRGAVERVLPQLRRRVFSSVLLDPPRTGLSAAAVHAVLRLEPPRVIYLSCDVATLARDAARFQAGGYRLVSVEAFDMFPNTAHIETLAVFDRGGSRKGSDLELTYGVNRG
jgi:tRNA/tmRNA/rRNA uracil-C5-methylase (TrmA/RlmC/RlmD family)